MLAGVLRPAGRAACTPPGIPGVGDQWRWGGRHLAQPPVPVIGDVTSVHDLPEEVPESSLM